MINKIVISLALLATLGFGASFEDGLNAYGNKDYQTAFKIFQNLGNKGDASAQFALGHMYEFGEGVRQDYQKAKEWYGKACDNGSRSGCGAYKDLNMKGY